MQSSKTESVDENEEYQGLPIDFIKDILISLQEVEAGDVTEYQFKS